MAVGVVAGVLSVRSATSFASHVGSKSGCHATRATGVRTPSVEESVVRPRTTSISSAGTGSGAPMKPAFNTQCAAVSTVSGAISVPCSTGRAQRRCRPPDRGQERGLGDRGRRPVDYLRRRRGRTAGHGCREQASGSSAFLIGSPRRPGAVRGRCSPRGRRRARSPRTIPRSGTCRRRRGRDANAGAPIACSEGHMWPPKTLMNSPQWAAVRTRPGAITVPPHNSSGFGSLIGPRTIAPSTDSARSTVSRPRPMAPVRRRVRKPRSAPPRTGRGGCARDDNDRAHERCVKPTPPPCPRGEPCTSIRRDGWLGPHHPPPPAPSGRPRGRW